MARHKERHLSHRTGWLRAAVLGANDGIISTASLILGVAAANASRDAILTAGVAGLSAGALAMGMGEYISVSSQRDTERADIAKEVWELENTPERELAELTAIYQEKGLKHDLAREVAIELTAHNALEIHLIEELGITEETIARPLQAAWSSMASFALGAVLPLLAAALAPAGARIAITLVVAILALFALGIAGAKAGGAKVGRSTMRVVAGGILAMAITMAIGKLFGAAVS
jgi:vacuolar iron transporter family protein